MILGKMIKMKEHHKFWIGIILISIHVIRNDETSHVHRCRNCGACGYCGCTKVVPTKEKIIRCNNCGEEIHKYKTHGGHLTICGCSKSKVS